MKALPAKLAVATVLVTLTLPVSLGGERASACSCGEVDGSQEAFIGRVGVSVPGRTTSTGHRVEAAEIDVLRVFKGRPPAKVTAYYGAPTECSITLYRGDEYIFLDDDLEDGEVYASVCSTYPADSEWAERVLEELDSGPRLPPTWGVVLILGGILVAGFGLAVAYQRQRR